MPTHPPGDDGLLALAAEAAARAYVPYSEFAVGAAILLPSGRVITAANVENASYGLTICAERSAVARMVAETEAADPDRRIVRIAVASPNAAPCAPCGACRQVLHEFGCAEVILQHDDGPRSHPLPELLPLAFGPDSLT